MLFWKFSLLHPLFIFIRHSRNRTQSYKLFLFYITEWHLSIIHNSGKHRHFSFFDFTRVAQAIPAKIQSEFPLQTNCIFLYFVIPYNYTNYT